MAHHRMSLYEELAHNFEQIDKELGVIPMTQAEIDQAHGKKRQDFWKGFSIVMVCILVMVVCIAALAGKHGGHSLGQISTFGSHR